MQQQQHQRQHLPIDGVKRLRGLADSIMSPDTCEISSNAADTQAVFAMAQLAASQTRMKQSQKEQAELFRACAAHLKDPAVSLDERLVKSAKIWTDLAEASGRATDDRTHHLRCHIPLMERRIVDLEKQGPDEKILKDIKT